MTDPTPPPDRPPLWLAMDEAAARADYLDHPHAERIITAAEIRAVRDYFRQHLSGAGWQTWQFREIADLLTYEAERAESGQ